MAHLARSRVAALRRLASLAIPLLISTPAVASESKHLDSVQTSRGFFNPSIGQDVLIGFTLDAPGRGDVWILDRDGFPTRHLACDAEWPEGIVVLSWDGRDDQGRIVADEAYSLMIDLETTAGRWSYLPGDGHLEEFPKLSIAYDMRSGVVSYELPAPSRVHIQAGTAVFDPVTGRGRGPVLKTIANREPRVGGRVIEMWNGLDESGQVRVFDLPNFAFGIAASALPENAIITVGNRETSFLSVASSRSGASMFTHAGGPPGRHHQGLTALDDVAPRLVLTPQNARWSDEERLWRTEANALRMKVSVDGPSAAAFSRQPGMIFVFIDQQQAHTVRSNGETATLTIPMKPGQHQATINWVSAYGPVAVNTVVVSAGPHTDVPAGGGTQ